MTDPRTASIGFVILAGIFIVPLFILWIVSLVQVRRKHDPARVGFAWMKAVFPLWILSMVLYVTTGALRLYEAYGDYDHDIAEQLDRAESYTNDTALFFERLANIFLFVTFVEIAGGYMFCLKGAGEPSPIRRLGRFIMLAWAFVLVVLTIAEFGLDQSAASRYSVSEDVEADFGGFVSTLTNLIRLGGALWIMTWLTTLPILGYGASVVHKTKGHPLLRGGAVLLLVCTILDFIRHLVNMSIYIDLNLANITLAVLGRVIRDPAINLIVGPVFTFIPMFVILVMLFSLGIRKRKGLWSQPPPEWNYPPMVVIPTAYPVMPVQPLQQPQQPQQFMPQQYQQQQPVQGLPAYLQVAQQKQAMQQQYPATQGYYYPPQQPQQQQQQQPVQPQPQQQQPQQQQQQQQQQPPVEQQQNNEQQ
ncbi:hypothetical protein VTG60DRAFT_4117 [Thermothelomyces hinnuleus]